MNFGFDCNLGDSTQQTEKGLQLFQKLRKTISPKRRRDVKLASPTFVKLTKAVLQKHENSSRKNLRF
jgi:hypothetical protein